MNTIEENDSLDISLTRIRLLKSNKKMLDFINPIFQTISDKKSFIAWVLNQYFDPQKNQASAWYKGSIDENTVLGYVGNSANRFPLTPIELVDFWNTISSFKQKKMAGKGPDKRSSLSSSDLFLDSFFSKEATGNEPVAKYQMGETTLKKIGLSLGGLSPMMVCKLTTSGIEKIKSLTGGVLFENLDEEAIRNIDLKILKMRLEAARELAFDLKKYTNNIEGFLALLVEKRIITKNDIKIMEKKEFEQLTALSNKENQKDIVNALLEDIGKSNNLFKIFQSIVSKKVFPEKRRGRPRKFE